MLSLKYRHRAHECHQYSYYFILMWTWDLKRVSGQYREMKRIASLANLETAMENDNVIDRKGTRKNNIISDKY